MHLAAPLRGLVRRCVGSVWPILLLLGCRGGPESPAPVFKLLTPAHTRVSFANTITATDSLNALTDPYIYNGAGVAVGDIDNDGLPDIFLAGNMVSSRLYLNKGNMQFEDITTAAGVTTRGWATGVSLVDINDDGLLDIYVCVSGPTRSTPGQRANLLFINQGHRVFSEAAARYGIADTGFCTQSVWLDYDGDGDLDLFLLNNSPQDFQRAQTLSPAGGRGSTPGSYNRLYRNNGDGTFSDVSERAGILRDVGYGLGVAVADLRGNGRPDIYVSNDITPNDVLYANNGDGTFTDKAGAWIKHASFAGMGVDIADFNNDGRPDILQADMMPPALSAQKRMSGFNTYGNLDELRRRGFRIDYDINSLQLNNGALDGADLSFSEISRLAGVAYTDWSWSALFADFDNDGYKDIFISNGYPKAVNDFDYTTAAYNAQRAGDSLLALQKLRELRSYEVPNYVFRNNGDLTFTDKSKDWGFSQPGFSYGAAYADLNNDGRLDLVINNINAPAAIYENVQSDTATHHYLQVILRGQPPNVRGIGSSVTLHSGTIKQYLYQSPYRGYMSTVDDRLHFGLGAAARVDTLVIRWPDGRSQVLTDLPVNRTLIVDQRNAHFGAEPSFPQRWVFERLDPRHAPQYAAPVITRPDYTVQPLLPHDVVRHKPVIAVGDVNGDGWDDVFVGGSSDSPAKLFLQRRDGSFLESSQQQPWGGADQRHDDWGARFFDANGDGRLDLYVASGGYQLAPISPLLQDRLYINQGDGRFVRDSAALPAMLGSTAAVAVGDFNGDGQPDLFVGGRVVPRNYPYPARSYLLRNDGGHFTDVTEEVSPELARPFGMITDAVWVDFDGDGRVDLVTAGEWMPLQFFKNDGKRLRNVTASMGLPPMRGWWYSLAAADFNHDGHVDLVAGNLGLNHTYATSHDSKFGVYAGSFTDPRTTDVVLTKTIGGREYPVAGLPALGSAIYTVSVKYPTYAAYSTASVDQLFSPSQLQHPLHLQADTFASVYLQSNGHGGFAMSALPNLAQIAPVRGIVAHDVDGDGNLDLVIAGNLYDEEPNVPRADAGNGLWLRGDGHGHFTPVSATESGFLAPLDVTGLAIVKTPAGNAVLVANNSDSLQAFLIRRR
jgi:hypothetical protein